MTHTTTKLTKIQNSLYVNKGRYNDYGGFSYRSLEDINNAVKPLLEEFGASLRYVDDVIQIGERYYVKATAIYADDEGEIRVTAYAREQSAKKGMDEAQITGSCSSYARKYAAQALFLLDDSNDPDSYIPNKSEEQKAAEKENAKELSKPITDIKKKTLTQMIERTGTDVEKFTAYFGKDIADFNGEDYGKALKMLMAKEKKGTK